MTELTPYHKLIPERIEILEKFKEIKKKYLKIHFKTKLANRELLTISYVLNPNIKETIMITAGCHGNEPAPIYAIYNFLKKTKIRNKRIIIVPCIVPYGFSLHIDKNENGIDINRDFYSKNNQRETKLLKQLVKNYKPSFVLNLHEDPDENMFYLYLCGHKKNDKNKINAEKTIKYISNDVEFYKRKKIHTDIVKNGIIENPSKSKTFEDYLRDLNIPNFCIETPGTYSLKKRIEIQEKVINFVIKNT